MRSGNGAQSAVEFISVYGWAFLVIAIFLAIAVILTSSKPSSSYLPLTCSIQPSLPCTESAMSYSSAPGHQLVFTIDFTNSLGKPLYMPPNSFNVVTTNLISGGSYFSTGNCTPLVAPAGAPVVCRSVLGSLAQPALGASVTSYFTLHYGICKTLALCGGAVYATTGASQVSIGGQVQAVYYLGLGTSTGSGYVAIDDTQYPSGANVPVFAGQHSAYGVPPSGYAWQQWSSSGILVANAVRQNTTITVNANGVLTANFNSIASH